MKGKKIKKVVLIKPGRSCRAREKMDEREEGQQARKGTRKEMRKKSKNG